MDRDFRRPAPDPITAAELTDAAVQALYLDLARWERGERPEDAACIHFRRELDAWDWGGLS